MGLSRGNQNAQQMVGMNDEQERELKKNLILIKMRRKLRLFWIAMALIGMTWGFFNGHDTISSAILGSIVLALMGYGITFFIFIRLLANLGIKMYLYFESLFLGKARL